MSYPFKFDADGRCFVRLRGGSLYPWARIVAWDRAGRQIPSSLSVHHRNGDPSDDRPENLQVVTPREHMAIHRRDLGEAMRKPRLTITCPTCGEEFERLPSRANAAGTTYCSRACHFAAQRVTECRHGHPRTPENTHTRSNGRTECLVCLRQRSKRNRDKQRSAA